MEKGRVKYCNDLITSAVNICINSGAYLRPALVHVLTSVLNDLDDYSDIIDEDDLVTDYYQLLLTFRDELVEGHYGIEFLDTRVNLD